MSLLQRQTTHRFHIPLVLETIQHALEKAMESGQHGRAFVIRFASFSPQKHADMNEAGEKQHDPGSRYQHLSICATSANTSF